MPTFCAPTQNLFVPLLFLYAIFDAELSVKAYKRL